MAKNIVDIATGMGLTAENVITVGDAHRIELPVGTSEEKAYEVAKGLVSGNRMSWDGVKPERNEQSNRIHVAVPKDAIPHITQAEIDAAKKVVIEIGSPQKTAQDIAKAAGLKLTDMGHIMLPEGTTKEQATDMRDSLLKNNGITSAADIDVVHGIKDRYALNLGEGAVNVDDHELEAFISSVKAKTKLADIANKAGVTLDSMAHLVLPSNATQKQAEGAMKTLNQENYIFSDNIKLEEARSGNGTTSFVINVPSWAVEDIDSKEQDAFVAAIKQIDAPPPTLPVPPSGRKGPSAGR